MSRISESKRSASRDPDEVIRVQPDPDLHDFAAISACSAAAVGVPVIPLRPGTKAPLYTTGDGHLSGAIVDAERVLDETAEILQERGQRPGWGIVTGDRIAVLDLDGQQAEAWLERFGREHSDVMKWAAATVCVRTGRGVHLYGSLSHDVTVRNSAGKLADNVDVRGLGGYVVAPGSLHPSGVRYALDTDVAANAAAAADDPGALSGIFHDMRGSDGTFAVAEVAALTIPDELLDLMRAHEIEAVDTGSATSPQAAVSDDTEHAQRRLDGLVRAVRDAPRGQGNARLNWAAAKAAAHRLERSRSEPKLVDAYLSRPTTERPDERRREARATIASGWQWGSEHPEEAVRAGECRRE